MTDEELGTMTQRHTRARDSVASAHKDRGALLTEVERLRVERAEWARRLVEAKKEGARSAVEEREAERAAVVAYLRDGKGGEQGRVEYADDIARGEHRREEKP